MHFIYVICSIVAVALQQFIVNGNHQQPEHGEEAPKFSCAIISEKTVPCSLSLGNPWDIEVFAGQTIKVALQDISTHPCFWNWESSEDSSKPTLTGQLREGDFVFLFQATDRHAGLATIQCRNESTNSKDFTLRIKLIVKPKRPSKPHFSFVQMDPGKAHDFTCKSEGSPVPEIKWYKDVHKSSVISKDIISNHGLTSVESQLNSYPYRNTIVMCCASNPLGEECSLLYDYALDRADSSHLVEVIRGQTLLLRCRYTQPKNSKNFDWFVNDKKDDQDLKISDTLSKYLYLNSSDLSNSIKLSCKDKKNNKTRSSVINVLEKGYINVLELSEINDITANEKSGFCINLTVHSFPLADCHWVTQTGKRVKCQGQENVFEGKSTYNLCGQEPGVYQLHLENRYTSFTKNVSLCVTDSPTLKLYRNDSLVFCMTESTQPYNLTWKTCHLSDECDSNESLYSEKVPVELLSSDQYCLQRIVSSIPHKHVQGFQLRCCLQNRAGTQCTEPIFIEKFAELASYKNESSKDNTFLLGVITMLVVIVLLVSTLLCYFIKKKKPVYQSQLQMIQMVGPADNDYIYIDFKDFKYDQKWEFPRENLELGKELGSGAFGMVLQATAYGITKPGVSMQVAVKMLKDKHQAVEREALMSELKMLTYIGHHTNIVNLLGACTHSGPTYLIFQYCCHGDLLNYLKNNREHFHKCLADAITKDRFTSLYHNYQPKQNNSNYQHPVSPYVHMSPVNNQESEALLSQSPAFLDMAEADGGSVRGREEMEEMLDALEDLQEEDLQVLTYGDLLSFSYQVAKGMEFLSSKNCIHRDLAARNVLVTRGRLVKIGDFGLARDIDNDSNYVVRGNARLPVKWMAPESIFTGMYTMQSDVWAYGILLWEIFSLGVTPYPGMKVDTHFYSLIERGFQMEQPYYSSESMYHVMRRCWALQPQDRPCFSKLVVFMENELAEMEEKIYLNVGEKNNNNSTYQNIAGVSRDPEPFQTSQSNSETGEKAEESSEPCGRET